MKRNWWKFLCAAFLFFTLIFGLKTPVAPGILLNCNSIIPAYSAPFKLEILGYNTRFLQQKNSFRAWLINWDKNKPVHICANSFSVKDDTHAELSFQPVSVLDSMFFDLAVYNDADGKLYMDHAIYSTDTIRGGMDPMCNVTIKNEKQDHFAFPFRTVLYESIRNLFFHVPMWFSMIALLSWALWNNLVFLRKFDMKNDQRANTAITTAVTFGVLGLITGSIWARITWLEWWGDDVKLNGTAITMLAYLAYLVLRNAIDDEQKRARVTAIYSIFAYVMMIVLIGVLPRLQGTDSLHPGNGGNPGFNQYDLDNTLRPVFYIAVAGWIMLGFWIYSLKLRIQNIKLHHNSQ
ncbi:MAG TPA: cytochrome c biogenesis protein CcsA [Bacteroidia bacterium]|nr:cytochrome c biogenesis protein CcsA [Bacteroidia bacterium]